MSSLESVWNYREEALYPELFGTERTGIYILSVEDFTEAFGQETVDPRWLHLGVFEFNPTPTRPSWLYVTSGGSTPWEVEPEEYDPKEFSWLGVELVIETPLQSPWAISILKRLLAYHVLICHGRFGDSPPLDYGHRIPLGRSIDPQSNSELTHIVITKPTHYPSTGQLDSGKFDFMHVVGVTEAERNFAKERSTQELVDLLGAGNALLLTDPTRRSAV